ncbi:ABC transporter ATP-binding protein [Olivibacter sitiensis]|uniref:ABC transporter ATP-binding protein n=1 Tax=Olivibacter sitiensis TaxID=376470 RepID=UPI0003FD07A3|nr:ABC transporter ATP-binding protein [Olivibacter sitiensis]
MSDVIEINGLTKRYGSLTAVDHLDLTIKKGEVFGLLGPNGAGKSTTILMMLGLTDPDAGTVQVCGINATVNPIEVKRRVGYLPDDVGFYENYSGLENLLYTARLNRISGEEAEARADRLLERVGLSDHAGKKAGKYSRGMRQRLGLADVLIKNPEVIILDEPTLGIDPKGVREFLDLIVQLSKEEGITVLLSSHHLHQVQQVCDRVGLFVEGKLLAEGDVPTLSRKLFPEQAFEVELGVSGATFEQVRTVLAPLEGIASVTQAPQELFHVACHQDLTARIAHRLVSSGLELVHLTHREYGLDEIYNRYFEGKEAYGKLS